MVDARAHPVQGSLQAALDGVSVARILTLMGMDVANTGTLDGEINLSLAPAADPEVHLTPASLLRRLDVDTSALNYRDAATETEVDVTIRPEHIDGKSMIKLVGQGRYLNQKVDCEAAADTLARLVSDQKHVYTVKADVATQDTQTQLHMTLGDPAATGETTIQVAIEGENPAAHTLFLGTSLPARAHYQLKGNIRRTGEGWHIERITAAAAGVD
jgi:hypothetical protein